MRDNPLEDASGTIKTMKGKIVQKRIIERNRDRYGIEHVLYEQVRSDGAILHWWDFAPCPACQGRGTVRAQGYLQETSSAAFEAERVCMMCKGGRYYFKSVSMVEGDRDDKFKSQE